jgi:hypothetical protein
MEARVEAGRKYDEFAHRAHNLLQLTAMSASDKMHLKLIISQAKSYNKGIHLKMPLLAPVHHFFGIQVNNEIKCYKFDLGTSFNVNILDLILCRNSFEK